MKTPLMSKREEVVENIRAHAMAGDLNAKVEVDDPNLSDEQRREVRERFLRRYPTARYRLNNVCARIIVNIATGLATRDSRIVGLEKLADIKGGAIITSNHFSPIDNTVVRTMVHKLGKRMLPVVGAESNLAMTGLFGYLMNYADVIPIGTDRRYMKDRFMPMLERQVGLGRYVLIYPEQEMWFNYRKPRPCKRGAYLFAAQLGVPIISCFVEIVDKEQLESTNFVEASYVMHVLDPIFPDPNKTPRENSMWMCEQDYRQKAAAYEAAYGKALDYRFDESDIAGWVPPAPCASAAVDPAALVQAQTLEFAGGR